MIAGNRIYINSSFAQQSGGSYFGLAGVDVFGAVNKSVIAANVIRETSAFALDVAGGDLADSDRLIGNDLTEHTSLTTDVYFDAFTSNMFFLGRCKSDIDQGVDNHIECDAGGRQSAAVAQNRSANIRSHMRDVSKMNIRGAMLDAIQERISR